jgi:hypothetical protein
VQGVFYDPCYGISYGSSEIVSDPIYSNLTVESITILDNGISSFYNIDIATPFEYKVQMNSISTGDIIVVYRLPGENVGYHSY